MSEPVSLFNVSPGLRRANVSVVAKSRVEKVIQDFCHIYQQLHNVQRPLGAGDVHQRLLVVVAVVDVDAEVEELGDGLGRPLLDGQRHGRVAVDVELDEQLLLIWTNSSLRFSLISSWGSLFQIWHLLVKF